MARPPAHLVVGPVELLVRRKGEAILDELRAEVGDVEVVDLRASELKDVGLPDLRTASLFGGFRAVVIREAEALPAPSAAGLLEVLQGPLPDAALVLLASGTKAIQKLAKRIDELGGKVEVAPPREWEERAWQQLVTDELRRHGRKGDRAAVEALLRHTGFDVGTIAEKVAQLAAIAPAGAITAEQVDEVVVGHGSRGSFAVADAVCDRDPAAAVRLLRGCVEAGDHPVVVLGALVHRLRSLAAVASGTPPRSVGLAVSPAQAGRLKRVRANFGPGELTEAFQQLAAADLEIKSGDLDAAFAVERAVVAIATRGATPVPAPDRPILRR